MQVKIQVKVNLIRNSSHYGTVRYRIISNVGVTVNLSAKCDKTATYNETASNDNVEKEHL